MMKYFKSTTIALLMMGLIVSIDNQAFSVSNAVKSQDDYVFTLNALRNINIMVENFTENDAPKKYEKIQGQFREAGEEFYGQNFDTSFQKFRKLKFDLIDFLDSIAQMYLERTKKLLDSTQKESFEILIKYSNKNTNFTTYFRKPFDPLNDVKPYEVTKFHYFYSRGKIESYLRNGYKQYHVALNAFKDPEIAMLRKKKNMAPNVQNIIIERFLAVIEQCREAKQYGIEIHRILNSKELQKSMQEFGISGASLDPIFDYRIPDEYKVDANDNLGLIHEVEKKRMEKRKQ